MFLDLDASFDAIFEQVRAITSRLNVIYRKLRLIIVVKREVIVTLIYRQRSGSVVPRILTGRSAGFDDGRSTNAVRIWAYQM